MPVYSETALKNIILEHIDDKRVVALASRLYYGNPRNNTDELEQELTARLLNKNYEHKLQI